MAVDYRPPVGDGKAPREIAETSRRLALREAIPRVEEHPAIRRGPSTDPSAAAAPHPRSDGDQTQDR